MHYGDVATAPPVRAPQGRYSILVSARLNFCLTVPYRKARYLKLRYNTNANHVISSFRHPMYSCTEPCLPYLPQYSTQRDADTLASTGRGLSTNFTRRRTLSPLPISDVPGQNFAWKADLAFASETAFASRLPCLVLICGYKILFLVLAAAAPSKMDYDAMVMDQDATGPSVKISDVSLSSLSPLAPVRSQCFCRPTISMWTSSSRMSIFPLQTLFGVLFLQRCQRWQ